MSNTEIYISVITLDGSELRDLADVATGGEALANAIRLRSVPRWLLRLIIGRDAMQMLSKVNTIVNRPDYISGLIKLLRDYDPGPSDLLREDTSGG